jgi:hypothetical protein
MNDTGQPETATDGSTARSSGRTAEGSRASRRNSLGDGGRSRIVFPVDIQERIDIREEELTADHEPTNAMERMLISEMARSGVQVDVNHARVVAHGKLMQETVDDWWEDDRCQAADNLAARLAKDPGRVAKRLEASLHGALWCLEQWRGVGASAAANGGLSAPQRQLVFDLMGISPLSRDHAERVPAADDKEALIALVAREVQRLERRIELVLKPRDKMARTKVRDGLKEPQDPESRNHRSNESRAHKRLRWAMDTFTALRRGVSPATIIDPETGQPLQAQAPAASASAPGSPAASTAPQRDHPQPPPDDPIPLPPGLSEFDQEMLTLFGAAVRPLLRAGVVRPEDLLCLQRKPPSAPTDQPPT